MIDNTILAYGEITILDLLDTATYIYYSANSDGSNATITPDSDTKYIGIYSGPVLTGGQPSAPPSGTVWSQYVGDKGDKGDKGDTGNGIASTSVVYQVHDNGTTAPTGNWSTSVPSVSQGQYLWTKITIKYTDETETETVSYSVSYSGTQGPQGIPGPPGADGDTYNIECTSNKNELIFYEKYDDVNNTYFYEFSDPVRLKLYVNNNLIDFDDIEFTIYKENEVVNNFSIANNENEIIISPPTDILTEQEFANYNNSVIIVKMQIIDTDKVYYYPINIRAAMSEELMKFSIHASSVVAAIDGKHIQFSGDGISMGSGETAVFTVDNNGDAYFAGEINATSGNIGNIIIENGGITGGGFSLNGEGAVLSEGATISNGVNINPYIKLGNAYLLNPSLYEHHVFIAGAPEIAEDSKLNADDALNAVVRITDEGIAYFGNICIDGKSDNNNSVITLGNQGSIYSDENSANSSWYLTPEQAVFNNILARGKISTSIFEQGKTQAIGGVFLFKQATKIVNAYSNTITLEAKGLEEGTHIRIINDNNGAYGIFKLTKTDTEGVYTYETKINNGINLEENGVYTEYICLIFGTLNDDGVFNDDYIGINANDIELSSLLPNAFTVSQLQLNNSTLSATPKVVIGKLPRDLFDSSIQSDDSYGLYATNAYLKGLLISADEVSSSGIYSTGISTDNNEHIVIWAGAIEKDGNSNVSAEAIKGAALRITREGRLYAKEAILENSVISYSDIITNKIEGFTTEDNTPLTITDDYSIILGIKNDDIINNYITIGNGNGQIVVDKPIIFNGQPIFNTGLSMSWVEAEGFSTIVADSQNQVAIVGNEIIYGVNTKNTYTTLKNTYINGTDNNMSLNSASIGLNFSSDVRYNEKVRIVPIKNSNNITEGYDIYIDE